MIGPIIAAVVIVFVLVIIVSGYKKAPPDTAYIISGLRKKVIIGKASVKIPFLERMDKLSLKLIAIDVKTSNAVPTADYINIQVDAAVNIKISSQFTGDTVFFNNCGSTFKVVALSHDRDTAAAAGDNFLTGVTESTDCINFHNFKRLWRCNYSQITFSGFFNDKVPLFNFIIGIFF